MFLEYKGESYIVPDKWLESQKKDAYNQAIEDFHYKLESKGLLGLKDSSMWKKESSIMKELKK